jgi:hypothetical protein
MAMISKKVIWALSLSPIDTGTAVMSVPSLSEGAKVADGCDEPAQAKHSAAFYEGRYFQEAISRNAIPQEASRASVVTTENLLG